MNYILFEDSLTRAQLLPLTFVRPIAEIRMGLLTIREKWEKFLKEPTSILTENYLSAKYPIHKQGNNILINS
ncbi:MAG: glucose-1-phosphate thymidylyltransferase, partial [Bacteroidetes bacterium]|nr:glucose-1-phosphate thymidylyltransferase [Bacteroidota bacterium]